MAISNRAKEITNGIYGAYGSGSGYLFGIEPHNRSGVEAIVQVVLDIVKYAEPPKPDGEEPKP